MQWNKKLRKNLNWYIPVATFLLIIIGLLAISSAVEVNQVNSVGGYYLRTQVVSIIMGIILIIFLQFFDYNSFNHYSSIIYLATISVLFIILLIGYTVAGGQRWINFGPINFQPSEMAKIAMILVLASVIDKNQEQLQSLRGFVKPFIVILIPFLLILRQNDLGTALVLLAIFIGMLYVGGANGRIMAVIFGGGFTVVVMFILSHFIFGTPLVFIKPYQLNRLIVFVNPGIDPGGIGYNLIQSMIALGSGQVLGKGWFSGTQNQLRFLPEKHTDFIFSVVGEEFGFIGIMIIVLLYMFLLWQIFNIAANARENYGKLIAAGVGSMFFFQVFQNIAMTMGMMPITGLPLPFISYGGSSMLSSLIAIGLVLNVNMRRKKILF
ncbi:rod shape-determining protein RodA [Natronospora cellulosivora (SeqCode)]